MPTDDKYVRVYYRIRSDDRFETIYPDDRHLAAWLRLLLDADATWPAPASIPRSVKPSALKALVAAGLVELLPSDHFRIHGLDNERSSRAASARVGGLASGRSRSGGTAVERPLNDRSTDDEPSQAKHRQAEQSTADARADDALSTYWTLMGSYPAGRTKAWIEELANEFGHERVSAAIASESSGDRQGLLGRTRDRLRSDTDRAEKARAAAEKERLAADAEARKITPEKAAEYQRRVREELVKMGVKSA